MSNFLVESLLPERQIHLVAGPSGAGKTRWLLHTLKQWEAGRPFLGRQSYPCPWVYVATDRTLDSVEYTLSKMGIEPTSINIVPAWGEDYKTLPQIFDAINASGAKLAVVEGFGGFADQKTPDAVRSYLAAVYRTIRKDNITLIGVVESPKMKPQERYENPRQRVSGAAAWAHYCHTIFLVEPEEVSNPGLGTRRLIVCPRDEPGQILKSAFDSQGRLIF